MPFGWSAWWHSGGEPATESDAVKVGRPHRDRSKVKASRKAARHNRR